MITENDRLSTALDTAAELWPEFRTERAELLRRIIDAGIHALEHEAHEKAAARVKAIRTLSGSLTGVWPADWREELRDEWPA